MCVLQAVADVVVGAWLAAGFHVAAADVPESSKAYSQIGASVSVALSVLQEIPCAVT